MFGGNGGARLPREASGEERSAFRPSDGPG